MRTLTRPMFNMGGPIKQGVMHGIREPYAHGSRAALVGNPVYPKTGGREHHMAVKVAQYGLPRVMPHLKRAVPRIKKAGQTFKDWASRTFGRDIPQNVGTTTVGGKAVQTVGTGSVWTPKGWVARDPIYRVGRKAYEGRGLLGKPLRWAWDTARTPTGALGIGYGGYQYLKGDGTPDAGDAVTGVMKPGGYPKAEKKTKEAQAAFANKQRSERVQKYMDMMGYDRSKKTAIADALIDASKIVSDRGTLDLKNIGTDLINPIIQATSKRLDKPEQIREAVGLMATKAEIEKDLSKEREALKTTLTKLQIKGAENTLKESESFEGALGKFLSDRKGAVDKATLERISRLFADAHGETFTVIEEGTEPTGDGLYMIDSGIYRVTEGNAKQIA